MRRNEYKTLEEFYKEYCGITSEDYETYIGLDFSYKGNNYRLCLEPIGKYYVYKVDKSADDTMPNFTTIGVFENLDEVLNSSIIGSRLFKEVIMDDSTIIIGKD